MKREPHVRFCEGLGCNSLGLLTYGRSSLEKRTIVLCTASNEWPMRSHSMSAGLAASLRRRISPPWVGSVAGNDSLPPM